ncbi:MAG TPA: dienelactone hydrolase family protein [Polyangiaceae bacterium]|nr:dienelactone hydrolase family protein [Polyangiaceae bacterium]
MISFKRPDGSERFGYLARPSGKASGVGLVVAHELWGVDDAMRELAERCAALGHVAFVPDLFQERLPKDVPEGLAVMASLDMADTVGQDLTGATTLLASEGLRVGLLGLCFGGALAVAGATRIADLRAAVCFYGVPDLTVFDAAQIRVPFLGHFAQRDNWCTPEKVAALEQRLTAGGVDFELHRYDADHAFMNPTGSGFSAAAAASAWQRTVEFIDQRLSRSS